MNYAKNLFIIKLLDDDTGLPYRFNAIAGLLEWDCVHRRRSFGVSHIGGRGP